MRILFLSVCALVAAGAARAGEGPPPITREVGIEQHLDAQVPLDLVFRDEAGKDVRLGDMVNGKPTVLVLAYYRCPMLCTQVLNGVLDAARHMSFDLGDEYNIVTVSFDAREQPGLAAAKKATYLAQYDRPGAPAEAGWHFLTGEQGSIDRLADAVGFRFKYDAKQDQFAHGSGIMVLTPQGKVSRYFYGIQYPPRDLRLSLVEASANHIGTPVDQVLLLCYHYDPGTGRYTPVVMNLVRLGGVVTVLLLGGFIGVSLWRGRRKAVSG